MDNLTDMVDSLNVIEAQVLSSNQAETGMEDQTLTEDIVEEEVVVELVNDGGDSVKEKRRRTKTTKGEAYSQNRRKKSDKVEDEKDIIDQKEGDIEVDSNDGHLRNKNIQVDIIGYQTIEELQFDKIDIRLKS